MTLRIKHSLRRDEVAQLAGVSVSWYTWLEQGRDIIVSDQVIESLTRILQLDIEERRHLFLLTRGMVPVSNENHTLDLSSSGYQAVLDALGISPAYLLDERFNVVAWNASACRVFRDFSHLSGRDHNAIWYTLTNPSSRQFFVQWDMAAQQAVASFRTIYDHYAGETWYEQFFTDLMQASPEFRFWWPPYNIKWSCDPHEKELDHPKDGVLINYHAIFLF